MNRQSYLDAGLLKNECEECIALLKADIADLEYISGNIKTIIGDEGLKSEALDAYKSHLNKYFDAFNMLIEADRQDIQDYMSLRNRVSSSYDGELIFSSYERAKRDRDDYQSKADDERRKAASFNTRIVTVLPDGTEKVEYISNPHESSARHYQGLANDCQTEMNLWQGKMDEFDAIEADTSGLFHVGSSIRTGAKAKLTSIDKKLISGISTSVSTIGLDISGFFADNLNILTRKDIKNNSKNNYNFLSGKGLGNDYSQISLRYLEEYYPSLLNNLLSVLNNGKLDYLNDIRSEIDKVLNTDFVLNMEEFGYSFEAISFLHDNYPDLLSSLNEVSLNEADLSKIRESIYNVCISRGICVYRPDYSLGSYNISLDLTKLKDCMGTLPFHTNSYSYAFGLKFNPITGLDLPLGGPQPGYFSGRQNDYLNHFSEIYISNPGNDGSMLVDYIQSDAKALGLKFAPYQDGMIGGARVALTIDTVANPHDKADYHLYYYDEQSGNWFTKLGLFTASEGLSFGKIDGINLEGLDLSDKGLALGAGGALGVVGIGGFVGIKSKKYKDDEEDAEEEESTDENNTVEVGEYYISRLDEAEFV